MDIVENLGGFCSHRLHLMEKFGGILPEEKPVPWEPGGRNPAAQFWRKVVFPPTIPFL